MKTIILHGEDLSRSYERLTKFINEAKSRGWEVIYDEIASTSSLFGKERLFVLKDYKILKNIKNLDNLTGILIVYNEGDIPLNVLKKLRYDKVEKFDLPKIIWKFLDNPSVSLLHKLIEREPIELIFHLLAKRLRKTKHLEELAKIDMDAKTGKKDLIYSLDLFIAKHLE